MQARRQSAQTAAIRPDHLLQRSRVQRCSVVLQAARGVGLLRRRQRLVVVAVLKLQMLLLLLLVVELEQLLRGGVKAGSGRRTPAPTPRWGRAANRTLLPADLRTEGKGISASGNTGRAICRGPLKTCTENQAL